MTSPWGTDTPESRQMLAEELAKVEAAETEARAQFKGDGHVCPECAAEKHRNCDGTAWCLVLDRPHPCCCECQINDEFSVL